LVKLRNVVVVVVVVGVVVVVKNISSSVKGVNRYN
jgi:hypothetical protein